MYFIPALREGALLPFSSLLREYRLAAGLTQRDLAEKAGLGARTVTALERGLHPAPYRDTVARFALALELCDDDRARLEASIERASRPRAGKAPNAATLPARASAITPIGNLGYPLTPLLGRAELMHEVVGLLLAHRLVTFVGSGGVGKTRAAIEVGASMRDTFAEGVWFVDLTLTDEGGDVASAFAEVLGVRGPDERDLDQRLAAALRQRNLLVIVDNCERLLDRTAALICFLLVECPALHVLATSRESLKIAGERVYDVLPLTCPPKGERLQAVDALRYGAVALFVERARAADRRFEFTDGNAWLVGEICRRLDGVALYIELATPSVRMLGLRLLARRLEERLTFLASGATAVPHRHQTLRALIDWSYDTLSLDERALFDRVAIFAGGCTLEAAEAVCAVSPTRPFTILQALCGLVDKSLVIAQTDGPTPRYRLLDSIREYALEKLAQRQESNEIAKRHAEWMAVFAERVAHLNGNGSRRRWLALIAPENDNARAALTWALETGEPALAGRIGSSFGPYWYDSGLHREGQRWLSATLGKLTPCEEHIEARVRLSLSSLMVGADRIAMSRHAFAMLEAVGDRSLLGHAYLELAIAYHQVGKHEDSIASGKKAIVALAELDRDRTAYSACAYSYQGLALTGLDRFSEARVCFTRAIAIHEANGDEDGVAIERLNFAELEFACGNVLDSLALIEAASRVLRVAPEWYSNDNFVLVACLNATACRIILDDVCEARTASNEALSLARLIQNPIYIAVAIQHIATIRALSGESEISAKLLGYVDRVFQERRLERQRTEQRTLDVLKQELDRQLTMDDIDRFRSLGSELDERRVCQLAMSAPS